MSSYNFTKPEDRARCREDRLAELRAAESGTWPRDIDDLFRWTRRNAEWAILMCKAEIGYLDDLEERLAAGDTSLAGYER